MSLTNNLLNLTTEGKGKGKNYPFSKFGQTKNIIYSDLIGIIDNNEKFTNNGKYYILNKDVVRNNQLEEIYDNLLTKSVMNNIMKLDEKQIYDIFQNAIASQRDTIVSLLVNRIRNKETLDLNKLDIISKLYGKNIIEIAEKIDKKRK